MRPIPEVRDYPDLWRPSEDESVMKCPHCETDLPSQTCRVCEKETPLYGRYCCHCGAALPEEKKDLESQNGNDLSDRILCSDGTCIGVINKDGICSECGKPYQGQPE